MSGRPNVLSTKRPIVLSTKRPVYQTSCRPNVLSTKRPVDQTSCRPNVLFMAGRREMHLGVYRTSPAVIRSLFSALTNEKRRSRRCICFFLRDNTFQRRTPSASEYPCKRLTLHVDTLNNSSLQALFQACRTLQVQVHVHGLV
jgi:hypothetical protein